MGRTATVYLRSWPRIDVDAPASSPGKMSKSPLDVSAPHRDLPAILASQAVQKCRRRTEDIEPGANSECIRQPLSLPASLDLGFGVVAMRERADAEPCIWREMQGLAHSDLVTRKAQVVVGGGVADRVML